MWTPQLPQGYEARKCRFRVASFCRGVGLDLSTADEKIVKGAIAVGPPTRDGVSLVLDMSANDALGIFADSHFDYVFDAHGLGNFLCTEAVLSEWWRVIAAGGHLILYEQDRDYYPHVGTPGASALRKKDLTWEEVWGILASFGNAELISGTRHNDSNEYSWQLIVRKKFAVVKKPQEIIKDFERTGMVAFPRPSTEGRKEALVIRYGALGDALWVTPVLRKLKEDGYHVVMNCTTYSAPVYSENPFIDEFIIHEKNSDIAYSELDSYWRHIGRQFDKIINLTKSVEGSLIKVEGSPEYNWPHEKRHAECNVNFQDRTMEVAGYPEAKGCLPELYFSDIEEQLAQNFLAMHEDRFTILWSLSGSAFHKTYPWSEYVANEVLMRYKDAEIITVGDETCKILEWEHTKTINKCGVWTVRQSYIMAKYANLVIGPDTGLLNAASCFDTPKIVMLSTNTVENLTKYWKNCTSVWCDECECYPCHRLIYTNSCPKGTIQGVAPKCMENIEPERLLREIDKWYQVWRQQHNEKQQAIRWCALTIADDPLTHRLAERTRKSFEKYHPDVPFYVYDSNDEYEILGETRVSASACQAFALRPRFLSHLLKNYDGVIYLDADTVVTARLDEFLEGNFDVAGSLNLPMENRVGPEMLNAGVHAVRSEQFCQEWTDLMYRKEAGKSNQVYFNDLAYSGRYNLKIVDEQDCYYNERSRPFWKDIVRVNEHLEVNDRKIKVLHWAGGVGRMENKLSSADFSPAVREFLNDVTQTTDFTEIEGQEVSQWT